MSGFNSLAFGPVLTADPAASTAAGRSISTSPQPVSTGSATIACTTTE